MNLPSASCQLCAGPSVLTALLLLSACAGGDGPSDTTGFRPDTAGVPVVQNPVQGTWADGEAWTVEEVFALGSGDAADANQFGEILGVDVDSDGNVYVADAQAQNIRVFDPSGQYLHTIGQPGEGPGEFGVNLAGVFVVNDELLAPDPSRARVSRFALDGTFIASERIDMTRGIPIRWDTSGGRLVAQRRLRVQPGRAPSVGDPIVTLSEPADTVAVLEMGQSVQITGGIPLIRQFEPEPFWDSSPDGRLVTGMSGAWRFRIHGDDGTVERIISRPVTLEPVTERDREAVREALREMYRAQGVPPEAVAEVIGAMEFADRFPAFASLAFGPAGTLWVQNVRSPEERSAHGLAVFVDDMGSARWGVFDAEGHYLGTVVFPSNFQPTRFIEDRMYGIARDELDVQSVRAYRVLME